MWFATLCAAIFLTPALSASDPSFAEFDRRAQAGEELNVVFLGASLTWGANATDPQLTSYRANVAGRLEKAYPKARFKCWDAAIGGTGSQLGVFRFERDVLRRKPDLVFLDFSANDGIMSATPESLASYESLVRRIILDAQAPVVQVIFPFKWDVARGSTEGMLRRDAHLAISAAYHTAVGDAITLAQVRVRERQIAIEEIWPFDGVHPGDRGYQLFADAAWDAYRAAVETKVVCEAPDEMLHATTYMEHARVRISTLAPLPAGWEVGSPNLISAVYDMLMSRWLDDETVASNKTSPEAARLKVRFHGSMVLLFGESTLKSGKYRCYIDGALVTRKDNMGKEIPPEFDAGFLAKRLNGNVHHVQIIAEGLAADREHTLEIEPLFEEEKTQEIRLESICVAGPKAGVRRAAR